jgi:hypothetical protein
MMKDHIVVMTQPATEVQNQDISFTIVEGGKLLGVLHVSKGNLEWWPTGNSVNYFTLSWGKMAKAFVSNGRRRKVTGRERNTE